MSVPTAAEQIAGVRAELERSYGLPPYEAIDAAWLALLKAVNLMPGRDEHARTEALLQRLPAGGLQPLLHSTAVEKLLALDPPLESLLTATHEDLDRAHTARQLNAVLTQRETAPFTALRKLVSVLRRVRNRRMHGFKTPEGPRDQLILSAATEILQQIDAIVLDTLPR